MRVSPVAAGLRSHEWLNVSGRNNRDHPSLESGNSESR
jgi:hypothetical protein